MKWFLYLVVSITLISGFSGTAVNARQVSLPSIIEQSCSKLEISPPVLRTWKDIEADKAREAAGQASPPLHRKDFRPTRVPEATLGVAKIMIWSDYKQKVLPSPKSPGVTAAPGMESSAPLATSFSIPANFDGVNRAAAGNWYPPSPHGAAGVSHFVEVTNSHLDIYQKAAPSTRVKSVTLANFFGYAAKSLFDPRVVYDSGPGKWIIIANAYAESATIQYFFIAVSQTSDPTGAFYIYQVNVSDGHGVTDGYQWDFPQVGYDQTAIIFTANFFNKSGEFADARMFSVAKSLLYNGPGQTLTPTLITGLKGTLAPPVVLDANTSSYLAAADEMSLSQVWIYKLTNSDEISPTLSGPVAIPVPTFYYPPNAAQPGTSATLDTLDARFANASTQVGNSLFQVHTIGIGGYARPRFYEFDTVNNQVIQSGTFSRSGVSHDFNASIAANKNKDVFVTWSATDPEEGINAEVRFSGRWHNDTPGTIFSPGVLLYGSDSNLTGEPSSWDPTVMRWGDHSSVSIDPADGRGLTAWIVNERILNSSSWTTRIGSVKSPGKGIPPAALFLILMSDDQPAQ